MNENTYLRDELEKKQHQLMEEIGKEKENVSGVQGMFRKLEKTDFLNRVNLLKQENDVLLKNIEKLKVDYRYQYQY